MKFLIILILGIAIGVGAVWFFTASDKSQLETAGDRVGEAAESARRSIQDRLDALDLRPEEIRDELEKSGQVVRRKAREVGQAVADATVDARITTAIKAKLVQDSELSAVSISVNTTEGIVTLSGAVDSAAHVGKAILLAMEVEGVREVISTLQVRQKAAKK